MNARAAIFLLAVACAPAVALPLSPSPVRFAPGTIDTDADEYGPAFTPDGKTVYFTRRVNRKGVENILVSELRNGRWSEPRTAEFSGEGQDKEPYLSPDGRRLFFASTRGGERRHAAYDLWYVERKGASWSEPRKLDAPVSSAAYDNYPAVSTNGTLYFGSERPGGKGGIDLYRARLVDGRYAAPENLGDAINTRAVEADPYIAPDESFLIFCSTRPGGHGDGDLYISYRNGDSWTAPVNLGATINAAEFDYTPIVSPDRKRFYWSRGWGEIYELPAAALPLRK
ncbi:MAG TPA: hypothetical protein VGF28_06515 [Thermoanaerobaculia bacterium]|jgi:hypothetical protein